MQLKHAGLAAIAAAALLAAPAFAQSSVSSSSGMAVNSGTGVVVTPGVPTVTVIATPSSSVAVQSHSLLPGGAMVESSSTAVLAGPSGDVSGSKTVITNYWANVPGDASQRGEFQRWQQLR
jgi:hypothetical protein